MCERCDERMKDRAELLNAVLGGIRVMVLTHDGGLREATPAELLAAAAREMEPGNGLYAVMATATEVLAGTKDSDLGIRNAADRAQCLAAFDNFVGEAVDAASSAMEMIRSGRAVISISRRAEQGPSAN